ncbi:MAG: TetR/AcrR family transcriptional regulator [Coriobacteriales bacterium]
MVERMKTRELLVESLFELTEEIPLDKVTVKMITDNCHLTKRTFYNYFHDKFELVEYGIKSLVSKSLKPRGGNLEWKTSANQMMRNFYEKKKSLKNICMYQGQNDIQQILYEMTMDTFWAWLETGGALDRYDEEDMHFLVEFFAAGEANMLFKWFTGKIDMTPEDMALRLNVCLPPALTDYFYNEEEGHMSLEEK